MRKDNFRSAIHILSGCERIAFAKRFGLFCKLFSSNKIAFYVLFKLIFTFSEFP